MENARQSVFMQMHNGTRTGEGSFNVALKELFYKADMSNRRKLVTAFPEFFGDEVPEFGITNWPHPQSSESRLSPQCPKAYPGCGNIVEVKRSGRRRNLDRYR